MAKTIEEVEKELARPFDPRAVKWKPAVVSGNRALALAYVDARQVLDRLDEVGVLNWKDAYKVLPDGSVMCRLSIRINGEWISKTDVGGASEQPDEGDRRKAAFSDALKRAAVKFGVGRYLYRLPQQWCDYDPHKKQFVRPPALSAWAIPGKALPEAKPAKPAKEPPRDGRELKERLERKEADLVGRGLCEPGALVQALAADAAQEGFARDLGRWSEEEIGWCWSWVPAFVKRCKERAGDRIGPTEGRLLTQEMGRLGLSWADVAGRLGVPVGHVQHELTVGEWRRAMALLRDQPAAEKVGA